MKKTIVLFLAILSVTALFSFAPKAKQAKKLPTTRVWWNFDGTTQLEMGYNWYYSLDDDNFPDCPTTPTFIYCEILAYVDAESDPEDPKPDLNTITNQRWKQ
jgi:hypothetical protein